MAKSRTERTRLRVDHVADVSAGSIGESPARVVLAQLDAGRRREVVAELGVYDVKLLVRELYKVLAEWRRQAADPEIQR